MGDQEKYRVVIVDDEPVAVRAIRRILETSCPAFTVAGEAENGRRALEVIARTEPDLVLTDIEMPVMSGLQMARRARERFPNLCFAVISGYQDYEYMREAIQSGVLDYLAKPIVPSVIVSMMGRVEEKLRRSFYERRNGLLREICQGKRTDERELARCFPHRRYYGALHRENGLPRRFFREQEPEIFGNVEEAFCVYGRDSMEELYLIPEPLLDGRTILSHMLRIGQRQHREDSYITLLYYGRPFSADEIPKRTQELYHWLNALCCVGVSQSVDLDNAPALLAGLPDSGSGEVEALLSELERYAKAKRFDRVKERLSFAYDEWERQRRPELWLEHASRRVLSFIRKESRDESTFLEAEYHLEDAFYYSTSMAMLKQNLYDVFYKLETEQQEKPKVDSPEFFAGIEAYLKENLADPLSLQSLSEQFAISQAYMSKLFRKYAGQSYAQYLTRLRMEAAKRVMEENPEFYIKDIAPLVGYQDQFYFSRIFRSYTGQSPAEYLKDNQ